MMSGREIMAVTNGYAINDGRSRWGNEKIIAWNSLRNRSRPLTGLKSSGVELGREASRKMLDTMPISQRTFSSMG